MVTMATKASKATKAAADMEGMAEEYEKYDLKDLKTVAKKYGIKTRCAKKIDIIKALPPEGLAELDAAAQR